MNLIAYELGARSQLASNFSVDVAFFVHEYSDKEANADHIVSMRSLYNVSSDVSFDAFLQYVTGWSSPALNNEVDDYLVLDVRLAWQATDELEIALVGQNLIKDNHEEWEQGGAFGGDNARVPRSAYAQISYMFR